MFELSSKMLDSAISYYCNEIGSLMNSMSGIGEGIEDMLIFTGDATPGATASIFGKLLTGIINTAIPFFQGMGIALSLLFCFIGIIELATQDQLTPEKLIKQFAKFAVSFGAIMYAREICFGIINLGNWFTKAVTQVMSTAATEAATLTTSANGDNPTGALSAVLMEAFSVLTKGLGFSASIKFYEWSLALKIPGLFMHIATIACFFMALTRGLELGIRTIFMPIPMGLMAEDGWRGAGGRYIKKYAAVATQGMVMIAGVKMMQMFVASMIGWLCSQMIYTANQYVEESGNHLSATVQNIASIYIANVTSMYAGGAIQKMATGIVTAIAIGDIASGDKSSLVMIEIQNTCSKGIWMSIAVVFAGLGMISKSLQICNDVWGV